MMSDSWACAQCRSTNHPEDRFCGDCGAPHEAPSDAAPSPAAHSTVTGLLPDIRENPVSAFEGAPLVLVAGVIAAVVLGGLYHYVARAFDIKILFPILLGLAIGWALRVAAIRARCRQAVLLSIVAVLAGAAAYGIRQAMDTVQMQKEMQRFLAEKAAEDALVGDPPPVVHWGFFDTLRLRAASGIGYGSARRASKGTLRGAGFWIFLLFEAALVAGVAAASVRPIVRHATCGACRRFVPSIPVFRVNARDSDRLVDAVRHQRWKKAQEMSDRASATPTDRAEAMLLRCGDCDASSIRIDVTEGVRSKKVMHVALPSESLEALARTN
jgi:hypothetical protein